MKHHQILIIGGGAAGIMTSARLRKAHKDLDIAIIEPAEEHYYQAAWTLVGAGTYTMKNTARPMKGLIPKGVKWIKDRAVSIDPDNNQVTTQGHGVFSYDYLIPAPGLVMDYDAMEGLKEALQQPEVGSNYTDPEKVWEVLQNFKGGNALFIQPAGAIKCGGAPQKIMYLAEEHFQKAGLREKTQVIFGTPGSVIFGVEPFKTTMEGVVKKKNIRLKTFMTPVKIDPEAKKVYFKFNAQAAGSEAPELDAAIGMEMTSDHLVSIPYDMLHVAPPQKAPDFIANSPLAYQDGPNKGWLEVDIHTLQHKRYPNVFGLGDAAALPTAKTGAAVRKQAPVVVSNILNLINENRLCQDRYEGYSSCPLVTGYGTMVLAEFKYDNVRDSDPFITKFVDTTKESWLMWLLKKYALPWLYWNRMMKGEM